MKKIVLIIFFCATYSQASKEKAQPNWNQLFKRVNQQLDRIDKTVNFLTSLWAPFPKAISLTHKHPIPTMAAIGCWAYLYKKEKKASYVYLAAIYYALYHRIQENKRYGLAARNILREREALALPSTSSLEQ